MSILDKLRRNTLKNLKLSELREEEIRLKNQLERLRKDINRIEKDKKKKFEEGIGADLTKKKMLAQEIKQLDLEAKLLLKNFMTTHKKYAFITNLVAIKKYEKQLENSPVWEKLMSIPPEELESRLINVNLRSANHEQILDDLNRVFEMDIAEVGAVEDEEEKQLFEAWKSVEAGKMNIEEVEKSLSIEKDLEKED